MAGVSDDRAQPPEKHVYGGVFHGRLHYIKKHFGTTGLNDLFKDMVKNGYDGPRSIKEIKLSEKYPVRYICLYNRSFVNLFGEEHLSKMARDSARRTGILGYALKWAGTPELLFRKAPEYWLKFYDFGRLESEIVGDGKGVIKLTDCRVDPTFCETMTHYFTGVGEAIGSEFEVEHTRCVFTGSEHCEWNVRWKADR
jgi:hypothetical protein